MLILQDQANQCSSMEGEEPPLLTEELLTTGGFLGRESVLLEVVASGRSAKVESPTSLRTRVA